MICSRTVFRCFKTLERWGDRLTGAAGPFFVGMAIVLIGTGTISFFDIIMPHLSFPWLSTPLCLLIAFNLHMHYYYVCTVPPGFVTDPPRQPGSSLLWAKPKEKNRLTSGVRWSGEVCITEARTTKCRKCSQTKPERTHHCRICNRCVLKYDHHCPVWINQCVGLHNERHFVMAYLCLSGSCFGILGYPQLFDALGITFEQKWPYHVPPVIFIMIFVLSTVLCLAVGVMLMYHLWTVAKGETTVEAQDHDVYRRVARNRGESFQNSYDLGKRKNLTLFFNIGENGYPWYTLILPLRIHPYTDGRSWARRPGLEHHSGLRHGEELTDEEEEEE
ncbi:DHHC palmitoyltransferase-domain-containing protein, partial [Mycena floridula]